MIQSFFVSLYGYLSCAQLLIRNTSSRNVHVRIPHMRTTIFITSVIPRFDTQPYSPRILKDTRPSQLALVCTDRVVEAQETSLVSPRRTKGNRTILEMNDDSGTWLYQTEFLQKEC